MSEIFQNEQNELLILPVLPVRGTVAFPGVSMSLDIVRSLSLKAIGAASKSGGRILLLTQRDSSVDDPNERDFYTMGTVCVIKQAGPNGDGGFRAVFEGVCRAKVRSLFTSDGYFRAEVVTYEEAVSDPLSVPDIALMREALSLLDSIVEVHPTLNDEIRYAAHAIGDIGALSDFIASGVLLSDRNKQSVLALRDPARRMEKLLVLMAEELDILRCEFEIHRRVKGKIDNNQKEFFLREQMRAIQQELGEGGGDEEIDEYYARIAAAKLPKEIADKLNKEVSRMAKTPYGSAEGTVLRN